jgi:hypothetical protein
MPRGGFRPGSGRKKKDRTPTGIFDSAEAYLQAVVSGAVAPDALRVAAAKALLSYQTPKTRAPVRSPTPTQLAELAVLAIAKEVDATFEKKAASIRKKFTEKD